MRQSKLRACMGGAVAILPVIGVGPLFVSPAAAAPISVLNGQYFLLDDRGANDLGFIPGVQFGIGANQVMPNGFGGTTATATTTDLVTGATVSVTVPFAGGAAAPNQFGVKVPYSANLLGPWTLNFMNSSGGTTDTTTVTTGSLFGVAPAPFAKNVTISGASLDPTFTWSYAAGSVNGVDLLIYDKSTKAADGSPNLVFSQSFAGTTSSFTLPTSLAGGFTLTAGNPYVVDLKGLVLRNPVGSPPGSPPSLSISNVAAQSQSYFDFTPTVSGVPVNLPTYDPATHNYTYSMSVVPGVEVFIDPQVAEGYDYRTGAGDPNFQSVELPTGIGDGLYDLYTFDAHGDPVLQFHDLEGGKVFDFGLGGVDAFRVLGIELSAMIDPTDVTAFVTGLTFTGAGDFTGTQTPLAVDTSAVPEPSGALLLVTGLVALAAVGGGTRRRAAPG